MIGLDTNVLVRVLTDEDDPQADRARELLVRLETTGEIAWLNHVVLCEFAWALVRAMGLDHAQLADLFATLLASKLIRIADHKAVEEALQVFRASRADFADALIGTLNRRAACETTYSLDHRAAVTADFTAVHSLA